MNKKLHKLVLTSLLIAIGFIFRQFIPAIGTMKLDGLMAVISVILLISQDFRTALLTGLTTGVIAALTTVFPGGQIPIFIDKLVSCLIIYGIIRLAGKYSIHPVTVGIIGFAGTIISGIIFLCGVMLLAKLPAPFMALFSGVVLPAAVLNIPLTLIIFNAVKIAAKLSKAQLFPVLGVPSSKRK